MRKKEKNYKSFKKDDNCGTIKKHHGQIYTQLPQAQKT